MLLKTCLGEPESSQPILNFEVLTQTSWDVCAGWVILKEAGGLIVDGNPGIWDIPVDNRKYLAVRGAPTGQKEIVKEFWGHVVGTMDYES